MSVMSNRTFSINDMNETGTCSECLLPGRCPVDEKRSSGLHPATAGMKWTKEINKAIMKCFYLCEVFDNEGKPIGGYRKRMLKSGRTWEVLK